ncbi:RDD family protein [Nonomuraea sp. NPDC049607]|uniref:RDD family protein n=1 Tax=Nonomuraea sp. NPDC049607 TaxID=3154732 RepID=UPI00341B01B5
MSRLTLFAWLASLTAAAYPTWDMHQAEGGASAVLGCIGMPLWFRFELIDLVSPPLSDASALARSALQWGVPAIIVLTGLLASVGTGNGGVIGRRVAGLLTLLAVAGPLTPLYMSDDGCSMIPVLSNRWFASVLNAYGPYESALLLSALLVLLATRTGGHPGPGGFTGRRAAAFAIDYLFLVTFLAAFEPGLSRLDFGLLNWLRLDEPTPLLAVVVMFLYVLPGRTFGKQLMRLRVVSDVTGHWPGGRGAAVRALVFPVLVCLPEFGLIVLLVDGLWAVCDPAARTLRDRLAGTRVALDLVRMNESTL